MFKSRLTRLVAVSLVGIGSVLGTGYWRYQKAVDGGIDHTYRQKGLAELTERWLTGDIKVGKAGIVKDSDGWIYPDGVNKDRNGNCLYDLSNPEEVILAFVEGQNEGDYDLVANTLDIYFIYNFLRSFDEHFNEYPGIYFKKYGKKERGDALPFARKMKAIKDKISSGTKTYNIDGEKCEVEGHIDIEIKRHENHLKFYDFALKLRNRRREPKYVAMRMEGFTEGEQKEGVPYKVSRMALKREEFIEGASILYDSRFYTFIYVATETPIEHFLDLYITFDPHLRLTTLRPNDYPPSDIDNPEFVELPLKNQIMLAELQIAKQYIYSVLQHDDSLEKSMMDTVDQLNRLKTIKERGIKPLSKEAKYVKRYRATQINWPTFTQDYIGRDKDEADFFGVGLLDRDEFFNFELEMRNAAAPQQESLALVRRDGKWYVILYGGL